MKYILGIDTSNYKTSIAVVDREKHIICDLRRFLTVKQGERGLRQSDALFQHLQNLPELMEEMRREFDGSIDAVACSDRPRPVEGSYMPVFLAGSGFAKAAAAALQVPLVSFSHQEGHMEAIRAYSTLQDMPRFLACHFSGGTCEVLDVSETDPAEKTAYRIEIIGGTKDISFGQVLDRTGVALGMEFPAGQQLDQMAENFSLTDPDRLAEATEACRLTPVKVKDGWLNLSGLDTQARTRIDRLGLTDGDDLLSCALAAELFKKISKAASDMIIQCAKQSGQDHVLLAGGVASSHYLRRSMTEQLQSKGITAVFGDGCLSQDNAVGTALLGGKSIWA